MKKLTLLTLLTCGTLLAEPVYIGGGVESMRTYTKTQSGTNSVLFVNAAPRDTYVPSTILIAGTNGTATVKYHVDGEVYPIAQAAITNGFAQIDLACPLPIRHRNGLSLSTGATSNTTYTIIYSVKTIGE